METFCFNIDTNKSIVDICFTESGIPLYFKTADNSLSIWQEYTAISFEEKVDDSEFILPVEAS